MESLQAWVVWQNGDDSASCRAHSSLAKRERHLRYGGATGTRLENVLRKSKKKKIDLRASQLQWSLKRSGLQNRIVVVASPACPQQVICGTPLVPPSRVNNGYPQRAVFYLSTNLAHVLKRKALTRRRSSSFKFGISPPSIRPKLTTARITPVSLLIRDRFVIVGTCRPLCAEGDGVAQTSISR